MTKSNVKTTDDEKTIPKKLDKFKENITEQDKKICLEKQLEIVKNTLTKMRDVLINKKENQNSETDWMELEQDIDILNETLDLLDEYNFDDIELED